MKTNLGRMHGGAQAAWEPAQSSRRAPYGYTDPQIFCPVLASKRAFIFLFVFCPQLLKGDFCSSGAEMLVVHKISHNFPSQQKKQFDTVSRIFLPIIAIQEETSESDDDSLVQITRKVNFVSNP